MVCCEGANAPFWTGKHCPYRELRQHDRRQRHQIGLSRLFRARRARNRAVVAARAAQRPDLDVHQCRHGAVQECLHRPRKAPLCARDHGAEMRARRRQAQRPRQCRLHGAAPHLLRDARQFLVRRLFQGARHRARLEADHQGIRRAGRKAHWPPSISTTTRRSGSGRRSRACRRAEYCALPASDNFWAMGETGPCGPCSEIFYDHGEHIPGGPPGSPEAEGDRFVEIWNLVFMQYEQLAGGKRLDLPRPSIDTGMGLERMAAVLQGTHDNYKIDLFGALIEAVADLTARRSRRRPQKASHRVIADHLRATSFLIADGVLPSNEGPRLCASPHHAPRHAPRRTARRQGAADVAARAGAGARDGPGLSGIASRRGADHRDAQA